ncbi:MAG: hypothetical protein KGO81_06015 [Bacteroidota bacterium]|nr:hypothetical protein [Bacteroidota bacterium]
MATYQLTLVSKRNSIVLCTLSIIFYVFALIQMTTLHTNDIHKQLMLVLTISLFINLLWKKFATAVIVLTLDQKSIELKWIKQFPFIEQPDKKIDKNEIISVKNSIKTPFTSIELSLSNGEQLKLKCINWSKFDTLSSVKDELKQKNYK